MTGATEFKSRVMTCSAVHCMTNLDVIVNPSGDYLFGGVTEAACCYLVCVLIAGNWDLFPGIPKLKQTKIYIFVCQQICMQSRVCLLTYYHNYHLL